MLACCPLAWTPSLLGQPLVSFLSLLRSHLTGTAVLTSWEKRSPQPQSLFLSLWPFFGTVGTSPAPAPPWLRALAQVSEPVRTQSPHLLNGRKNKTLPPPLYSASSNCRS